MKQWLHLPDSQPERIGETWQVYDENRICNGHLAGMTLAEATRSYGAALIGTRPFAQYGADFPLLAKFIDAAQPLSIQVHPDDEYAHTREHETGFHGKTEAWYILQAEDDATVLYGLTASLPPARFREAIASGAIEGLFHRLPVRAGDVIFVPAGTIHAIDSGITLFEIQQKSDLTYRVYDYGRVDAQTGQPRQLHLEKALAVSALEPAGRGAIPLLRLDDGRDLLVACPLFALEQWQLRAPLQRTTDGGSFEILTTLTGGVELEWEDGTLTVGAGESLVLPASVGAYVLTPADGDESILLRVHVPDLEFDYLQPLLEAGISRGRILETVIA